MPNIAYLSWSLDVDCPKCEEEIDLCINDCDQVVSGAIFNNKWDDLKGHVVTCIKCKHEFVLGGVEY